MKIWITRHGQTDLNAQNLMQGRSDIPLNEVGISQAKAAREKIGDMVFDAVYSSPLDRAITTASIIGGVDKSKVIIDERIIEADFGKYEKVAYSKMGLPMILFWMLPEIFPCPEGTESTRQMIERSHSFLKEIEKKNYENVLVACHGGIIRTMRGYMEDSPKGYVWRPRPKNCEILVYESINGVHRLLDDIK